jgi:site-specific DNA-cytosine methylase
MAHSSGAPAVFRKSARAQTNEDSETWVEGDVANTLNSFDVGDVRTTHAIVGGTEDEDDLLPVGLDSHRYRCCGNGVVAPVAEWIGRRIVEVDRRWREEEAK